MSGTKQLRQLANSVPRLIDKIDVELQDVSRRMKALERAGLIYASEHWREEKYLYLIYPMREGDRRRVYIGADAERVAAARAGIERGREFDQLAKKRREIESCMNNASSALRDAVRSLQW